MPATNQNLKDFFALTGNNPAVTNAQLQAISDWHAAHTGTEDPTPDDIIDGIYTTLKQQVISHKRATSAHSF